jgi:type IV secretory pathway TrbD component
MTGKPKHTGLAIALGAALGVMAGILAGNVGVWIAVGIAIGMVIGVSSRRKATECPRCAEVHRAHEVRR